MIPAPGQSSLIYHTRARYTCTHYIARMARYTIGMTLSYRHPSICITPYGSVSYCTNCIIGIFIVYIPRSMWTIPRSNWLFDYAHSHIDKKIPRHVLLWRGKFTALQGDDIFARWLVRSACGVHTAEYKVRVHTSAKLTFPHVRNPSMLAIVERICHLTFEPSQMRG